MSAPIQAPTNIAAMNGPRRRRLAKKAPPLDACHALVSSEGTTIKAIASLEAERHRQQRERDGRQAEADDAL